VHLDGFSIRICHDARSPEHQNHMTSLAKKKKEEEEVSHSVRKERNVLHRIK